MHYFEHASKFRLTSKPSINKMKSFLPKAIEYKYDPRDYIWIIWDTLFVIGIFSSCNFSTPFLQGFSLQYYWICLIINCDLKLKRYWDRSRENKPSDVQNWTPTLGHWQKIYTARTVNIKQTVPNF